MRALCWHGKEDIRCDTVPDPKIVDGRDAIIKVTACAICGSDLHLMGGFVAGMKSGDIMGHETMGEVVEVGKEVAKLKVGDRVVVPFTISCGECRMCKWGLFSLCERSNPAGQEQGREAWGGADVGSAVSQFPGETVPSRLAGRFSCGVGYGFVGAARDSPVARVEPVSLSTK